MITKTHQSIAKPPNATRIVTPDEILVPIDDVSPLQRQLVKLIISILAKNESSNLPPHFIRDAAREF